MPDPPLRVLRLANPVVLAILRSRAHPLLSQRLLALRYRGRRSGRAFEIPLRYAELGDGRLAAVALRPEQKHWWRAFREPSPAALVLRGTTMLVTGTLTVPPERASVLARYSEGSRRLERVTRDAAVVVFTPTR